MKTVSLKTVIYRLTSNRLMDATFLDDLLEWLPQGMEKLKTQQILTLKDADLEVVDHVCHYPCGFQYLEAVETLVIEGTPHRARLREGSDVRSLPTVEQKEESSSLFVSNPISVQKVYIPTDQITQEGGVVEEGYYTEYKFVGYRTLVPYRGEDLKPAPTIYINPPFYKPLPDLIQTSFANGKIRMHYRAIHTDKEGYPLIPNHEDYLTALEWYGLSCMIKAGYQHSIFSYQECYANFEKHGRRAINDIRYPTPEKMERILQHHVRLVPPQSYYDRFNQAGFYSPERLQ